MNEREGTTKMGQKAKEMKDKAADDYKAKNFDGASEKYYQVINIIREND